MDTQPLLLLAAYSVAIVGASLLGGWLPSIVRMTHTRTQVVMSFVAGLMLGVAVYHLLPHGIVQIGGSHAVEVALRWLMLGLVLMLLLLRLFHFHQHDFSEVEANHHDHAHAHGHGDGHGDGPQTPHSLSWLGIAFGLALHTLIDGIALGAAVNTEWLSDSGSALVGLGVFLAVVLHKPLDALSITAIMKAGGWSARARLRVNLGFALLCPLGAVLFLWGVNQLGSERDLVTGCALAFSAGVFLCIALGDLLPEVHFHSHDKLLLTLSFLFGIGLAYAVGYLEPAMAHAMEGMP